MPYPSIIFKKLLCKYNQSERHRILYNLLSWLERKECTDEKIHLYNFLQQLYQDNSHQKDTDFKKHYIWDIAVNYDSNPFFQQIVNAKLSIPLEVQYPPTQISTLPSTAPRRNIPKKIRGEVWKQYFNTSTSGSCYCCKTPLDAFGDWHAGHILSRSEGGTDTQGNLRPICGSCNLSMGTENMDAFKNRCYPDR